MFKKHHNRDMNRREFLRLSMIASGGLILNSSVSKLLAGEESVDLVMVRNGNPLQLVRKSLELLGGMKRFIKPGQTVVIKPNMSWDRTPEFGANNHPEVAAEVTRLCVEAGAKKILVFDRTCNDAKRCYINSGVEKAMSDAGANVRFIRDKLFEPVAIPDGYVLKEWDFYRDVLEADVFINLPVLKHHSISRLTMGFKNMMGLIGGRRGQIHRSFDQKIVDVNRVLRPQLTILDAVRMLTRNGPSGGNLNDVRQLNTIIAGVDPVLVDSWGAELAGVEPKDLSWLKYASQAGLGSNDTATYEPLEYSFI